MNARSIVTGAFLALIPALVVGFAADYTLRALARRAVDGVIAPFRRRQHVLTERRVVTELTVVERGERKR